MKKDMTWPEAEALEKRQQTGLRRAPWTGRLLIYEGSLWLFVIKDDAGQWAATVARGLGPNEAEGLTRFTLTEFLSADWTDEPEVGGSLPPRGLPVVPPAVAGEAPGTIITGTLYAVDPSLVSTASETPALELAWNGTAAYGAGFFVRWNVPTGTDPAAQLVGRLLHESQLPFTPDDLDPTVEPLRGFPLHGQSVATDGVRGHWYRGTAGSLVTPEQPLGTGSFTTLPGESWWCRLGTKIGPEIVATTTLQFTFPHVPISLAVTAAWVDAPDSSHVAGVDAGPDGIPGTGDDVTHSVPCWSSLPGSSGVTCLVTIGGETGGTHLVEVSIGGEVVASDTVGVGTRVFTLAAVAYGDVTITATYEGLTATVNLLTAPLCSAL